MTRNQRIARKTARTAQARRRSTRGNVMVEMALISIVFLTLLIASFDIAQFLYIHQSMVERMRSSARTGVAKKYTDTQIENLVRYGNTGGTGTAFFGLTDSMVTVTTSGLSTDDAKTEVTIGGYNYVLITPFGSGSYLGPPIAVDIPRGAYD